MREIKFRAWDGKRLFLYMSVGEYGVGYFEYVDSPENLRVMQYTGLKDKNGKEIYEGDILKDPKGKGEVKWVQEHCANLIRTLNPHMYHYLESDERLTDSEVISNIYENPELLEVN